MADRDDRVAVAIGAAVLAIAAIARATAGHEVFTADFTQIWAVCRAALAGISPYDEAAVRSVVPADASWPVLPFAYPPWTVLALLPLGALDLDTAGRLWATASFGMAMAAGLLAADRSARIPGILFAAFSLPTMLVTSIGQLTALPALGLGLVLRGGTGATALGLALLAAKPHLGLPIAAGLGAWTLVSRDRAAAVGWAWGAGLAAIAGAASFALDPRWLTTWPAAVDRLRAHETVRVCDTCASATATGLGSASWAGIAGVGAMAVAAVAVAVARPGVLRDRAAAVCLATGVGLVFLPYVRNYDHLLAAVVVAAGWGRAGPVGRALLAVGWLAPWAAIALSRPHGAIACWAGAAVITGVWCRLPLVRR